MDKDITAVYNRIESIISELGKESWKSVALNDDGEEFIRIEKEISIWKQLKFYTLALQRSREDEKAD